MSETAWFSLLYILIAPWPVDAFLFLLAVRFAGKRSYLAGVVVVFVILNLVVPVSLALRYMGAHWEAGVALVILVRGVEFWGFSLGDSLCSLWKHPPGAGGPG